MRYTIIFEKSKTGYGAYLPDLPGCLATGRTLAETKQRIQEAAVMHLAAMRADGDSIPEPTTITGTVEVEPSA